MFYDKFIDLCKKRGIKPTPLVIELGLSSSNVSQWKKGSTPRPEVLKKLAEYFDVSVGYLVGEDQKEKPAAPEGSELDLELAKRISTLSQEERDNVASYIEFLLSKRK